MHNAHTYCLHRACTNARTAKPWHHPQDDADTHIACVMPEKDATYTCGVFTAIIYCYPCAAAPAFRVHAQTPTSTMLAPVCSMFPYDLVLNLRRTAGHSARPLTRLLTLLFRRPMEPKSVFLPQTAAECCGRRLQWHFGSLAFQSHEPKNGGVSGILGDVFYAGTPSLLCFGSSWPSRASGTYRLVFCACRPREVFKCNLTYPSIPSQIECLCQLDWPVRAGNLDKYAGSSETISTAAAW